MITYSTISIIVLAVTVVVFKYKLLVIFYSCTQGNKAIYIICTLASLKCNAALLSNDLIAKQRRGCQNVKTIKCFEKYFQNDFWMIKFSKVKN